MRKDSNTSVFFNSSISFKILGALQLNRCNISHDASLCRYKPKGQACLLVLVRQETDPSMQTWSQTLRREDSPFFKWQQQIHSNNRNKELN